MGFLGGTSRRLGGTLGRLGGILGGSMGYGNAPEHGNIKICTARRREHDFWLIWGSRRATNPVNKYHWVVLLDTLGANSGAKASRLDREIPARGKAFTGTWERFTGTWESNHSWRAQFGPKSVLRHPVGPMAPPRGPLGAQGRHFDRFWNRFGVI